MVKNLPVNAGDAGSIPREDPLEEEMVTHSSILAWEILGTEEPGGLQSKWSQRLRHYLKTEQQQSCSASGRDTVAADLTSQA